MNENDLNMKQDIMELCNDMSEFFVQLGNKMELIPEENIADIVFQFEDYFSEHRDVIGRFSEIKNKVREIELLLK